MFFNNKFNTFFGLNLTLVYTFPMCMTWRFHFPLRNYDFKDNGIKPRSVVTVSHADALYKSFKLTVSVNDVAKTLDADFWPEGIMVRRYRTQSSKWRESLTN